MFIRKGRKKKPPFSGGKNQRKENGKKNAGD